MNCSIFFLYRQQIIRGKYTYRLLIGFLLLINLWVLLLRQNNRDSLILQDLRAVKRVLRRGVFLGFIEWCCIFSYHYLIPNFIKYI